MEEVQGEGVPRVIAGDPVLGGHQRSEAGVGSVDAREPLEGRLERGHELLGEAVDVDGPPTAALGIGVTQAAGDLVAEADVVDDQAVELLLAGDRVASSGGWCG